MKCIDEIPAGDLKGKRVLLRSDFNLPIGANGEVADAFRLTRGWKTVRYLADHGARVIIISHIGREGDSIEPVAREMRKLGSVVFIPDIAGAIAQDAARAMHDGNVILLENVRRDEREAGNDEQFARSL